MEPDRRSAPIKTKIYNSDVYDLVEVKEVADSIENMHGTIVSRTEFKNSLIIN